MPRQHFFVDHERKDPFPDINWNKGELRARTESYFDIRIVKAPDSRIRRENDSVDKTGTRKGRPNTSEQIRSAVEHAWKTDSTFRDLPNRQVQAEEIRARLCGERAQRAHDMVGFSDSTIKRIIGEVFKKFGAD